MRHRVHDVRRAHPFAGVVLALVLASAADAGHGASGSPPDGWNPEPATYGVVKEANVPVTMSDGTVLRADVYRPADPGLQPEGDR